MPPESQGQINLATIHQNVFMRRPSRVASSGEDKAPGEGFEPSGPLQVTSYPENISRLAPSQARRPRRHALK